VQEFLPYRRRLWPLLVFALLLGCSARTDNRSLGPYRPDQAPSEQAGLARFVLDDFGGLSLDTLETNAVPYKLVATALLMDEARRTGRPAEVNQIPDLLRRYGFLYPDRIANWSGPWPQPRFERPLGMVSGEVRGALRLLRIDAVNLGCATCHAGPTYDSRGYPTREVWLGLPNTSIDLEAYLKDLYRALKAAMEDSDGFREEAERLFPGMDWRERWTLRLLIPKVKRRLAECARGVDAFTPFSNGGPGRTNGVAALKQRLGLLDGSRVQAEFGFTSIPELGFRELRSSLLYDGLYAPRDADHFAPLGQGGGPPRSPQDLAAVVTFFTVPTMGMEPDAAERAIPSVTQVMAWFRAHYAPPPFPGPVDGRRAARGRALYGERCARCHGDYDDSLEHPKLLRFPNRPSPQEEIGSDPQRWKTADSRLVQALAGTAYVRHVSSTPGSGYVAPVLSGLWATAPYLHNGSVPTLWQLMNPELRPTRFQVGGHRLDYDQVGIAGNTDAEGTYRYPEDYRPWSVPEIYDTARPGQSNRGHEAEFRDLSPADKQALLEYLKEF
jgi:hypothetical protein